jgi:hypothetical protein
MPLLVTEVEHGQGTLLKEYNKLTLSLLASMQGDHRLPVNVNTHEEQMFKCDDIHGRY